MAEDEELFIPTEEENAFRSFSEYYCPKRKVCTCYVWYFWFAFFLLMFVKIENA